MPVNFDGNDPEPSSLVGFAQNRLVRDSENRNEQSLAAALDDSHTRFHLYCGSAVIVRKDDTPTATFSLDEAGQFEPDLNQAILLGMDENGPRLGVPVNIEQEAVSEPYELYDFRKLLYSSAVTQQESAAIAQGGSVLYWNSVNQYCGKCGSKSEAKIGGYRRDCANCSHNIFPRTDPVVIMLAIRGNKCLLGRSPHFPQGWYSTLAGFVEPGETMEDAVRRETFEESGIKISKVKYYASQPWPFPHSLMIGVHCEAISDEIHMDANELEDCRWFTRDEVKLMIEEKHPNGFCCPPSKAVASALIRAWVEQ